ncbi:MAG: NUDIX domain-containing protein, partial [Nevskia sp.]|nr:NUDIX domain-containing protein [Nevskia sp.]
MSQVFKFCPRCTQPLSMAAVDQGPPRLRCPDSACGFVHWDNPVPVVAAVVEHQGEVVLARNRLWPPKMFALITGFLEKDDPDPASGVLREVDEELGLKGRVAGFIGHYPFERMNQIIIAYHVVAEGDIVLGEELLEYKKVPPEKLRPWPAATGLALRDWMLRRGLTPLPFENEALKAIQQLRVIDDRLATAGQPTAGQMRVIRGSGYQTVINLLPADSGSALADEAAVVEEQGLRYHYLPVSWEAPGADDFARFCELMQAEAGRRVLVHCAANKRVSAFVFLYRVLRLGVARDVAERDLLAVWQPDPVWSRFIDERLA